MLTEARSQLTDWMRQARLNERTADFFSEEFLRPHKDLQKGAHGALQMFVPSALLSPLMHLSTAALDAAQEGITEALNPLTPQFTLENIENLLFTLASMRGGCPHSARLGNPVDDRS
jgi:hypothetical protein